MARRIGVARMVEAVTVLICCFCATASAQRVFNLTAPVGGKKWFGASQNITWTRTGTGWTGSEHDRTEFRLVAYMAVFLLYAIILIKTEGSESGETSCWIQKNK